MELSGKRVLVMGLGRFGGGVGVTRYLAARSALVRVTDLRPATQLRASLAQLDSLPIQYRLGRHDVRDFTETDLIVVNPAVDPRNNCYLQTAQTAGVPLTSEIRLLIESLPNRDRTIGVTGTAGKSTVTAMIGHILAGVIGQASVYVGGNLGGSLLEHLEQITNDDWIVLELSSFMLETLRPIQWSPHIAVVTNISANHLDRHETMNAYASAKQVILDHQDHRDYAVLGCDVSPWLFPRTERVQYVDQTLHPTLPLIIPGQHNQLNAALAIEATASTGIDPHRAAETVLGFSGLPHRLQFVCQIEGVRYYNDSKATTPQAAIQAIGCFDVDSPPVARNTVHAILGGFDKAVDLVPLGRYAGQRCGCVYTIGTTGTTIARAAQTGKATVVHCGTLDHAVDEALRRAHNGDVVLLSPGCASWDQFDNYQDRGTAFIDLLQSRRQER